MGNCGLIGAFSSTSGKADTVLDTNGQILYYNNGRKALDKEDNDDILTLKSGLPSWEAPSAGGNQFLILSGIPAIDSNAARYFPLAAGSNQFSGTESYLSLTIYLAFTIQRHTIHVTVNGKDGATTQGFRDDGSTVAPVTITAATTGEFDSGSIDIDIASGSVCDILIDLSASSSGSIEETLWCMVCS